MRKYQLLGVLVAAAFLMLASSCTGLNYMTIVNMKAANTNPTPTYASGGPLYSGGALYHFRSEVGPIGNAPATKSGEACASSFLWLIAAGDASVSTAKQNGGISKVASIEYQNRAVLGALWHQFCTVVHGS